jgi:hypothetical protein
VNADQFTHSSGGRCAGVGCRFYRSNIAAYKYRDVSRTDIFFPDQLNIGCLYHCVGCLDSAHEAFSLDHPEGL